MKNIQKWLEENATSTQKFYDNYDPKEDWIKTRFFINDRAIGKVGKVGKNDFYLHLANMEKLIEEKKLKLSKYRELREMNEVKKYVKKTLKEFADL